MKRRPEFILGKIIPQTDRNEPFIPVHSTGYSCLVALKVLRSGTLHEIAQRFHKMMTLSIHGFKIISNIKYLTNNKKYVM